MVIYLIENWFSGAHYRVFRGIGRAENQVDRGTFGKCRPSQVGMLRRVSALGD